jgi:signal peptidase II
MIRSLTALVLVASAVLALDQWTKRWATEHLAFRPPVPVIGEFLQLTYTRNSGVAFGLGAGTGFPYYLFSIAAAGVILWMFLAGKVHGPVRQLGLSLILGGALGNLVDRLKTGEVVDFIQILWGRFPVFNVADTAVSAGVALFAWSWTRDHRHEHHDAPPAASAEPPPGERADVDVVGPAGAPRGAAGPVPRDGTDGPLA